MQRLHTGFTLLETLVALIILCISLGAVFGLFSTALQAAADADAITRAIRSGESLINRLGTEIPLTQGVSSGDLDSSLHWQVTVTPLQDHTEPVTWQMPLQGYWVEVEISWENAGRRQAMRIATLRLAPNVGAPL